MSRCRCGARIVFIDYVEMLDGRETFLYTCGVCGTQIELKVSMDPRRY